MIYFDKTKYKKLVLSKYGSYENFSKSLQNIYGLDKKKDAVTKWGQNSNANTPISSDLPIIAEALDISVVDLFDNAEKQRETITKQELNNNYIKYKDLVEKLQKSSNIEVSNSTNTIINDGGYFENSGSISNSVAHKEKLDTNIQETIDLMQKLPQDIQRKIRLMVELEIIDTIKK